MKVTVTDGIRVVHDGKAYQDGQSADVPAEVAKQWIDVGWASEAKTEVKAEDKPATKSAPKTR